mmetsp:Transcript_24846/g.36455  ORF Transcript_24846/g.36455 Transcript_24846/m.36455 type:complete len:402 (+) Transcript_24846:90-1295(+)
MGKLDVELGKAVGFQRTKAGSGDKEEAFLIRSTLLKFAGAFCLVFLVVGGLAIFLSQWEVSFQQGINLDERVEHEAVEQEAFTQFMQVGNLLSTFLRGESHKKQTVQEVELHITKAVDALIDSITVSTSSDDIQKFVDAFSDSIYSVLDEYSELVGEESSQAKQMLASLNNIMAEDDVMPESREKIRPVKGAKNALQRTREPNSAGAGRAGANGKPAMNAKARLAAMGGDLSAIINRVFDRVDALKEVVFPDQARDALTALHFEVSAARSAKEDLAPFLERFKDALRLPGVRGVDVKTATSSDREMALALKEIVQLFPVLDNIEQLEKLKLEWESEVANEGEIMHSLHKMTRDKVLPFEWVTNMHPFGAGPNGRKVPSQAGGKGLFAAPKRYQWWTNLHED